MSTFASGTPLALSPPTDGEPVTTLTAHGSILAIQTGTLQQGYLWIYTLSSLPGDVPQTSRVCQSSEYKRLAGQGVIYGEYLFTTDQLNPSVHVWNTTDCARVGDYSMATTPPSRLATYGKTAYVGGSDGVYAIDMSASIAGTVAATRVLSTYAGPIGSNLPVENPSMVAVIGSTLFIGPATTSMGNIWACAIPALTSCTDTAITGPEYFSSNPNDPYLFTDERIYWVRGATTLTPIANITMPASRYAIGSGTQRFWPFNNGTSNYVAQWDFSLHRVGRLYPAGASEVKAVAPIGNFLAVGCADGSIKIFKMENDDPTVYVTVTQIVPTVSYAVMNVTQAVVPTEIMARLANAKLAQDEAVSSMKRDLGIGLGVPLAIACAVLLAGIVLWFFKSRGRGPKQDTASAIEAGAYQRPETPASAPAAAAVKKESLPQQQPEPRTSAQILDESPKAVDTAPLPPDIQDNVATPPATEELATSPSETKDDSAPPPST
ncbi:hypothetical protein DFJ77DRAFT_514848 [Powellomyces hirtus]|nr:hypothetical protein DFJ77DRAFT_514848 [Powellomyces hirtus]